MRKPKKIKVTVTQKIKVTVTQHDIDTARPGISWDCAVQHAVRRAFGYKLAVAITGIADTGGPFIKVGAREYVPIPSDRRMVLRKIFRFDTYQKIKPFTFTMMEVEPGTAP